MTFWRLLPYHVGSSAEHVSQSDALVRVGSKATLWWHSAGQPTLLLGASQKWDDIDRNACARAGVQVVRRQSGGTAVLALPDVLGLDVFLPSGHPFVVPDVVESYRWLGEVWLHACADMGIGARLVSVDEARAAGRLTRPHDSVIRLACFGSLSPYEVTLDGRKLVGLAQVRRSAGILLQAGIHLRFDADTLSRFLGAHDQEGTAAALKDFAMGLDEAAPSTQIQDVVDSVHRVLTERYGDELHSGSWTEEELSFVTRRA